MNKFHYIKRICLYNSDYDTIANNLILQVLRKKSKKVLSLPFFWSNRVDKNITMIINNIWLWHDWVFILNVSDNIYCIFVKRESLLLCPVQNFTGINPLTGQEVNRTFELNHTSNTCRGRKIFFLCVCSMYSHFEFKL